MHDTDPFDVALDSLRRRMAALHSLYADAVASMGPAHVNHCERDGVVPIAFSLFHVANLTDVVFERLTGAPQIWNDEWDRAVGPSVADHGKDRTVDEMIHQRIGDYEQYKRYQSAVFERTEGWLDVLDPTELGRVVVPRPIEPWLAQTFSARVAGPAGITLLDAAECWLYEHGLRHMGEIEHARGLAGLQGMTS